jgi:hypothetical protein
MPTYPKRAIKAEKPGVRKKNKKWSERPMNEQLKNQAELSNQGGYIQLPFGSW